ncbi:hypothetical protein SB861_66630, partial [Paraburkholderia sp. SIMBA_049]
GHQDPGGQVTDAGNGFQQLNVLPDWRQRESHRRIQISQRVLKGVDELQMEREHRTVMGRYASAQCFA